MKIYAAIFICAFSCVTMSSLFLNTEVLADSETRTRARKDLKEFLSQQDYKKAYEDIKKSGNKSDDEQILKFLLESNGYENWNKLTAFDKAWVVDEVTGRPSTSLVEISKGNNVNKNEKELAHRIIKFYHDTYKMDLGPTHNMWLKTFFELKYPIHETLLQGDEKKVIALLNNPSGSNLFYGFDGLCLALAPDKKVISDVADSSALEAFNLLRELAAATGMGRLINPESPPENSVNSVPFSSSSVENMLQALDKEFGFKIDFPNPYPGEAGLKTSRGIASYRSIQALYQAWKCAQLLGNNRDRPVLEIGGGLGRAAYYAQKFGLTNYTIVDLPMTCVAQAHFLASILGPDSINLYGENRGKGIHILPPHVFFSKNVPYDLIVNFDGLTEMAPEMARKYWAYIEHNSPLFLSVNHEANPYTVRDLYMSSNPSKKEVTRFPYWLRDGYVEEIVKFSKID